MFFFAVFVAAWALRTRTEPRKLLLLAASYFFYGYWDWRFMALLAGSSLFNYGAGLAVAASNNETTRYRLVALATAANLGLLGLFKYYNFFIDSLTDLTLALGIQRDMPFLEIILPIGISFFTFQGISYVVDVYRRQIKPVTSPIDLALYISFFPQLVAGPIVRASHFLPQLTKTPVLTRTAVAYRLSADPQRHPEEDRDRALSRRRSDRSVVRRAVAAHQPRPDRRALCLCRAGLLRLLGL